MSDPITPRMPVTPGSLIRGLLRGLWNLVRFIFRHKFLYIPLVLALVALIGFGACTYYVPPGHVGLLQTIYGSDAGIKPEPHIVGLHFVNPLSERMHIFPADLQVINYSDSPSERSSEFRSTPSIKIQTSDGYQVQLDVTVLYRIKDTHKVFTEAGPGRAFEDRLVIPRADRILRKTLGELNAEQFYQGPHRIQKAKDAHDGLAAELEPFGIQVDGVLVRRYAYDQKYQEIIESRKIKDQTVYLRQAEAKAAIEERKRDTIISEGKATVGVEASRGESEVRKLNADADLYKRKKDADGKLLVDLAEAKGTQLENDALQGTGSENMVGLKMAEVLDGLSVIVLPTDGEKGLNPLDLSSLLKKFEVQ